MYGGHGSDTLDYAPKRLISLFCNLSAMPLASAHPRLVRMDELYLVGDIVDICSLRCSYYWPQLHNNVLRRILGKTKHGIRVNYVPGTHDEELRDLAAMVFGNFEVHRECIHTTAQGQRLLVMHGDEFDGSVECSRWLAALCSGAYDLSLSLNRALIRVRHLCGYRYWSLASYLKSRVGNAMRYVQCFEEAAAYTAVVEDRSGQLALWRLAAGWRDAKAIAGGLQQAA